MADPRRVVDVGAADEAGRLLRDVVALVGEARAVRYTPRRSGAAAGMRSGDRRPALRPTDRGGTRRRPGGGSSGTASRPRSRSCLPSSDASDSTSASTAGSSASIVLNFRRFSRVVQRCTPDSVQSWKPATAADSRKRLFDKEEEILGAAVVRSAGEFGPIEFVQSVHAGPRRRGEDNPLARKHQRVRVVYFDQRVEKEALRISKIDREDGLRINGRGKTRAIGHNRILPIGLG